MLEYDWALQPILLLRNSNIFVFVHCVQRNIYQKPIGFCTKGIEHRFAMKTNIESPQLSPKHKKTVVISHLLVGEQEKSQQADESVSGKLPDYMNISKLAKETGHQRIYNWVQLKTKVIAMVTYAHLSTKTSQQPNNAGELPNWYINENAYK